MIEDTWIITEAELGGQKLQEGFIGARLILQDGDYLFQNDRSEYHLGTLGDLNTMDIVVKEGPNEGKKYLAIYEEYCDTLRICYDLTGKTRPCQFATAANSQQFLVTYQRDRD
jgi:uncharacterized protein (TIGR03067 family)